MDMAAIFKGNLRRHPAAEQLTLLPARGGASRAVRALVETQQSLPGGEMVVAEREELLVTCLRDESDPDVGGVFEPAIGDCVQRAGEAAKYAFTGDVLDKTAYSLRFRVGRDILRQVGVTHTQRL